jgi:hypothetical protein
MRKTPAEKYFTLFNPLSFRASFLLTRKISKQDLSKSKFLTNGAETE